eukprot:m.212477 g.212477  ORF g.212477 m.212477 type:complete len:54 (-) comp17162_c0_seq3:1714-1875(-)
MLGPVTVAALQEMKQIQQQRLNQGREGLSQFMKQAKTVIALEASLCSVYAIGF